jgi:hypothetical protein
MADDFALMHDVENACAEFAQSLETYAEFLRRHPGTEVDLPKGQVADVPLTGAGARRGRMTNSRNTPATES